MNVNTNTKHFFLQHLICNVGILLLTKIGEEKVEFITSGKLLMHLSRCLIKRVGSTSSSEVFFKIEFARLCEDDGTNLGQDNLRVEVKSCEVDS